MADNNCSCDAAASGLLNKRHRRCYRWLKKILGGVIDSGLDFSNEWGVGTIDGGDVHAVKSCHYTL